jgi:hypothetical protein
MDAAEHLNSDFNFYQHANRHGHKAADLNRNQHADSNGDQHGNQDGHRHAAADADVGHANTLANADASLHSLGYISLGADSWRCDRA